MASVRPSAAHATVVFLRIPGFAQSHVSEQAQLKTRLDEAIDAGIRVFRDDERIVLDGPEGAAVVVLANPRAALQFAWRVRAHARDLPLTVGLTHGPVRVAEGGEMLHGDALAAAEVVSGIAPTGSVSASREFRDALSRVSPDASMRLPHAGTFVDAHDRSHELFHADERSHTRSRRRFLGLVAAAFIAILAIGGVIRIATPRAERPGTLVFDIKPAGEIFVNGVLKGSSPPLKSFQLAAGKHAIEIQGPWSQRMATELMLAPGEELLVQHTFTAPEPEKPAKAAKPPGKPGKPAWRRFLDKFN